MKTRGRMWKKQKTEKLEERLKEKRRDPEPGITEMRITGKERKGDSHRSSQMELISVRFGRVYQRLCKYVGEICLILMPG